MTRVHVQSGIYIRKTCRQTCMEAAAWPIPGPCKDAASLLAGASGVVCGRHRSCSIRKTRRDGVQVLSPRVIQAGCASRLAHGRAGSWKAAAWLQPGNDGVLRMPTLPSFMMWAQQSAELQDESMAACSIQPAHR